MSQAFQQQRQRMVLEQLQARGITDRRVLVAMASVPREEFLPDAMHRIAYADQALAIDCGQTISQPYIVAIMTEALALRGGERVLEIGTGSGYQTAVLAELSQQVVTIERYAELYEDARQTLGQLGYDNIAYEVGDGTLGSPALGPFDGIIVTAAAPKPPAALLAQLADGGRLVVPVGDRDIQRLHRIRREGERLKTDRLAACRFVPLIGAQGWPDD